MNETHAPATVAREEYCELTRTYYVQARCGEAVSERDLARSGYLPSCAACLAALAEPTR